MRYLLTEKEMKSLVNKVDLDMARNALDVARDMIVGDKCIHSKAANNYDYCDTCALGDFTSKDKNMKRVICNLPRNYSK